jgi:predicted phage-related endonuclease
MRERQLQTIKASNHMPSSEWINQASQGLGPSTATRYKCHTPFIKRKNDQVAVVDDNTEALGHTDGNERKATSTFQRETLL